MSRVVKRPASLFPFISPQLFQAGREASISASMVARNKARRLSHGRALGLQPKVGSVVAVELLPYSEHADEIAWAPAASADPVGGPRLLLLPKNTVDPLKL